MSRGLLTSGDRPVSSKDVAQLAGLSQSTVSRVLNNHPSVAPALRDRVEVAMRQLGYVPNAAARSLITNQTGALGLVITNITNPFFAELIEAIASTASEQHYSVVLSVVPVQERSRRSVQAGQIRMLVQQRVDGLILTATRRDDSRTLLPLLRNFGESLPVVAVRPGRLRTIDTVGVSYRQGTLLATEHLQGHGCRRIAYIGGREISVSEVEHLAGYLLALRRHGTARDERLVSQGEFTYQSAYDRLRTMVERVEIDGIVTSADTMAMGCLDALADSGLRVPDDVRVLGFDDIPSASFRSIQLSSVRGVPSAVGRHAVQLILDRVRGAYRGPPRNVTIPPELILRRSCGCSHTWEPLVSPSRSAAARAPSAEPSSSLRKTR
jgi:LacI family transcriptional regulator